jgi:tetratricopeptide (TPR) repeat protein
MSGSILGVANSAYIDAFFSSNTVHSQTQLTSLANNALSRGIDHYQKGNYGLAINAFKSSAALSPFTDNSAKAYDYTAKAYLAENKTDEAIKIYKEAIRIYPVRDDFHLALGDIYAEKGNQSEALKEYEAAVRFNPDSNQNRYSLGQSYLSAGQLGAARAQFQAVVKLSPNSATGYFGIGQVARAEGDLQEAAFQFNKAISVNKAFLNSYRDLGYVYADIGDLPKANEQLVYLSTKNSAEATKLQDYIAQASAPKIDSIGISDGFNTRLGPATTISDLNANLVTPGGTRTFSVNFVFSKEMNRASITNPYNWNIARASIVQNHGVYNGGLAIPQTEATILPIPVNIMYDDKTNTAAVQFQLSQNAKGDATLDPKHIVFRFYGTDAYGKAMDTSADEYSGFSGIV